MSLQFPVGRRTILLCDYGMGGFRSPEMIKRRPAIVISPRLAHRDNLCSLVPLSGTQPRHATAYVVKIALEHPLPEPFGERIWWAKCDMLATVALTRLDLFRTKRVDGARSYFHPKVDEETFDSIMTGVLHGLGLGHLTLARPGPHWG